MHQSSCGPYSGLTKLLERKNINYFGQIFAQQIVNPAMWVTVGGEHPAQVGC